MAFCLITTYFDKATLFFEEIIDNGILLLFDNDSGYIAHYPILHSNSLTIRLPGEGKYRVAVYYDNNEVKRVFSIKPLKEFQIKKNQKQ